MNIATSQPASKNHLFSTIIAWLIAALAGISLYYIINPVWWNGLGKVGAIALLIAPQLLLVTAMAIWLTVHYWRRSRYLTALAWFTTTALTAYIAFSSTTSLWHRAHRYGVPLSIPYMSVPIYNGNELQPSKTLAIAKTADGTTLLADHWLSKTSPEEALRPVIVKVHGGAWMKGTRSSQAKWNNWLNELGYDVIDISYRLAPPPRWQDAVGDVKCALGWVAANAEKYRFDNERISLMGHSAGGHLAMLAAYSMGDERLPASCVAQPVKVRSIINFYGPADLPLGYRSSGSIVYVQNAFQLYIGATLEEEPARYQLVSPITHIKETAPATLTLLGEKDRIVSLDQAAALDKALQAKGVYHETYYLPASDHGFDVNWSSFASQIARSKIDAFLKR